jgi:hypothetical protein
MAALDSVGLAPGLRAVRARMVRLPPLTPGAWDHAWITAALAHESNIRALRADMIIAQPTSLRTVPGCAPRRIASAMANSSRRYTDVAAAAMKPTTAYAPTLIDLPLIWMPQKHSDSPVGTHMPFLQP